MGVCAAARCHCHSRATTGFRFRLRVGITSSVWMLLSEQRDAREVETSHRWLIGWLVETGCGCNALAAER